jgi:hypothetical protein
VISKNLWTLSVPAWRCRRADEVRKLAERTQKALNEAKVNISSVVDAVSSLKS